jgi:hypothetical protein
MKNDPSPEADRNQDPQEGLLHFPLEGLLPANQRLVLNLSMRTATLFSAPPDGEAQVLSQQRFTPNGMRVLLPLLEAIRGTARMMSSSPVSFPSRPHKPASSCKTPGRWLCVQSGAPSAVLWMGCTLSAYRCAHCARPGMLEALTLPHL